MRKETYVYLDTSHLQKWENNSLTKKELEHLNKLKESGAIFVISLMHILEIIGTQELTHILKMANFIESLSPTWIMSSSERIMRELKHAHLLYKSRNTNPQPAFYNRIVDILPPTLNTLSIKRAYGNKNTKLEEIFSIFYDIPELRKINTAIKKIFPEWKKRNLDIIKITPKWKTEVVNRYKDKLIEKIISIPSYFKITNEDFDPFINHLIAHPDLIKSFSLDFFAQHLMHKDSTIKWGSNSIGDLEHCSSVPYVDIFSCDAQMFEMIKNTRKIFKKELDFIHTEIRKNFKISN